MNTRDIRYIAVSISILLLAGVAYVAIQQEMHQNANDPQIQLAEDSAEALTSVPFTADSFSADGTDIGQSLAPFADIYDATGTPVAGSGRLQGKLPVLPAGVFDSVRKDGESRITWQPAPGLRAAIVVVEIKDGVNKGDFVMVGRSLREVEEREGMLSTEFGLGALALLIVLAGGFFLTREKAEKAAIAIVPESVPAEEKPPQA